MRSTLATAARLARRLAGSPPADRLLRALGRRGAVLACHGVVTSELRVPPLHSTLRQLTEQIALLQERGSRFIPLSEFVDRLMAGRSLRGCATLTFDDAYRGTLAALPALRRLAVPATVFVPTGLVGRDEPYWWDRLDRASARPADAADADGAAGSRGGSEGARIEALRGRIMRGHAGRTPPAVSEVLRALGGGGPVPDELLPASWDALVAWTSEDGYDCAPHTVTHPVLPLLDETEQRREIAESYAALRERLGRVTPVIAYPFGLYAAETLRAAAASGLRAGVTMDRFGARPGEDDPLRIPRLPWSGGTPAAQLGLFTSGPWKWLRMREWSSGYPALPA